MYIHVHVHVQHYAINIHKPLHYASNHRSQNHLYRPTFLHVHEYARMYMYAYSCIVHVYNFVIIIAN